MRKKLSSYGKAVLIIGGWTLLLLFVMNTELHLHPFSIHIYRPERLMEVFIQVCAFLFVDYHGRREGFKEGAMFTLDMIEKKQEKRQRMKVNEKSFWKFFVACLRTGNKELAKNLIKQNKLNIKPKEL